MHTCRVCALLFLKLAIVAVALTVAVLPLMATGGSESGKAEPIMIGIIEPLTGDCAQWGIPIVRGGELWVEEQNAQGGILCGDGKRHPIIYKSYENVCYLPSEEIKAAKKAILEDKMKFILQTYTPSCRKAIAPLCEQEKVLNLAWGSGYLSPKYPHTMGAMTAAPMCQLAIDSYIFEKHAEIGKVALLSTDDSFGRADRAYNTAACAIQGDKVKIVADKLFDPKTTDYSAIIGSILVEGPDAIFCAGIPPAQTAIILETAYNHGYNGYWTAQLWDLSYILKKVPAEWMEGKFFAGFMADFADPYFGQRWTAMYKSYTKKYGEDQWIAYVCNAPSILATLEVGLKASKSIDPTEVMKTLYAMQEVDHPLYGKSKWGGLEVFGCNHHLLTPNPILMVTGGKQEVVATVDVGQVWARNKDILAKVLKEHGQVYLEE